MINKMNMTISQVEDAIDDIKENTVVTSESNLIFEIHGIEYSVARVSLDRSEKPNIKIELQ